MAVFWVVAPLVEVYSLANFYQTTRRYNPQDSHLRTHYRENLKSYKYQYSLLNTSRVIKSKRMPWSGNGICIRQMRNTYNILVRKT
jgi:hypothetical protein